MPFAYYDRLTRAQQRTYRASDRLTAIELPPLPGLRAAGAALERALAAESRPEVRRAAEALCTLITGSLSVEPVSVRVLTRRPRDRAGSELHGLYTWEEGKRARIEVWMRTAQHRRVVAFRTFLRTLLHEVCHHLDYAHFGLADTFHTEGFFRRESSLCRQVLAAVEAAPAPKSAPQAEQLDLWSGLRK